MTEGTLEGLHARTARAAEFGHDALIVCDSVVRIYQTGRVEVQALQGLDLLVARGEMIALVGASGSGKSTLLSILSGIDVATAGRVRVGPWDLMAMTARQRVAYRRSMVGFVWQQAAANLVQYLTAAQNVALPMNLSGAPRRLRRRRVGELLELVGVAHCARRRPRELSGGSSSASPSPSRSRTRRRCCSPTSRRASWTPTRQPRSSRPFAGRTPSSARQSSSSRTTQR